MDKADITIIGAGVVGLAIAAELAHPDLSVFILEKNTSPGGGISSRNSEVIHAGIYYPEGSLKAGLCVAANPMLYDAFLLLRRLFLGSACSLFSFNVFNTSSMRTLYSVDLSS